MVENQGDFAERFEQLRAGLTYQELSDAILARLKVRITPQAMNKWVKQGGGITLENAKVIAAFFKISPSWLLFGETGDRGPAIEDAIFDMADDNPQQTIDFIEYKLQRSSHLIASDKLASYMTMISSIRDDLNRKKSS